MTYRQRGGLETNRGVTKPCSWIFLAGCVWCLALSAVALGQTAGGPDGIALDEGIPVADPLVISKCGTCHASDERGNMQRVSTARTTPEGWQNVVKQMVLEHGLALTPAEARPIVRYLSGRHGLAPAESRSVMYDPERRFYEETTTAADPLINACAKCHYISRPLSWRRTPAEWKRFADAHAVRYKFRPSEEATAFLSRMAPLHNAEWDAWRARGALPEFTGRWLVTAALPGRGRYTGEMQLAPAGEGEFDTRVTLISIADGSRVQRTGHVAIYGDSAWRGRSSGRATGEPVPDNPASDAREVLWVAPDHSTAEGRWFWGQYQEFGFDVHLQRPAAGPSLTAVDKLSLKIGSHGNHIRILGDNLPAKLRPADLTFGPGILLRSIVSSSAGDLVAEVDVAADAQPGRRDIALGGSTLSGAIAVYDRIDYLRLTPDSAMASFGDRTHPRGYQPFDAIGYQRGPDGRAHTADDIPLGPVDVTWALEVFHSAPGSNADFVGTVTPAGLLVPAPTSPGNNFDVWVIATARDEKDQAGKPLVGKAYVVVTIPTYSMNGRQYVRDLDRWVDIGPAVATK